MNLHPNTSVTLKRSRLKLDPDNEKKHPPEDIRRKVASLRRFGQQRRVVIDIHGQVIAGEGIFLALGELGIEDVKCRISGLTAALKAAYRLADNRLAALSRLSPDLIAATVKRLQLQDAGVFNTELLALTPLEMSRALQGNDAWQSKGLDVSAIPDYSPDSETFVLKVGNIKPKEAPALLKRINKALKPTGYEATSK